MRFDRIIKQILEAIADVPPPPASALVQTAVNTVLTFDDIFNFIKEHEGYRPGMYKDTRGIPTIGIGFNLMRPDAKVIARQAGVNYDNILSGAESLTDSQIKSIFEITLKIAYSDAKKWVPIFDGLPRDIKLAVLDMSFNLGFTRLNKFVKTREFILSKNFTKAAEELQKSKWATQVGKRAQNIINLFLSA